MRPTLEGILERALREQPSNVVGFVVSCLLEGSASSKNASGGTAKNAADSVMSAATTVAEDDPRVEEIFAAVKEGDLEKMKELLGAGVPASCQDAEKNTLLHYAAEGESGCVEALIAGGCPLDVQNLQGRTALMQGVLYEDAEVVAMLLKAGASASSEDVDGKTAAQHSEDISDPDIRQKFGVAVQETEASQPVVQPRRNSVSSESIDPKAKLDTSQIPVYPKDESTKARIVSCIKDSILFRGLDEDTLELLINAMAETKVEGGKTIITQGEDGDFFYIVDSGAFDCFVKSADHDPPGKKVLEYKTGGAFGELALMYNTPRAASVIATEDALVWALDRLTFRTLLLQRMAKKRLTYENLVEQVRTRAPAANEPPSGAPAPRRRPASHPHPHVPRAPRRRQVTLLQSMESYERSMVCDAFEQKSFDAGKEIVTQGEAGENLYIVSGGNVDVEVDGNAVRQLGPGGHFGEVALMRNCKRTATVKAGADGATVVYLDRKMFERLLEPVFGVLEENAKKYTGL